MCMSHVKVVAIMLTEAYILCCTGLEVETLPMSSGHSRSQARVKEEGCDRLGEST